jgi:hypothetical protein
MARQHLAKIQMAAAPGSFEVVGQGLFPVLKERISGGYKLNALLLDEFLQNF